MSSRHSNAEANESASGSDSDMEVLPTTSANQLTEVVPIVKPRKQKATSGTNQSASNAAVAGPSPKPQQGSGRSRGRPNKKAKTAGADDHGEEGDGFFFELPHPDNLEAEMKKRISIGFVADEQGNPLNCLLIDFHIEKIERKTHWAFMGLT